jgi:hypothetical protein
MVSITERGFGARLANARKILQAIETDGNYQSTNRDLELAQLQLLADQAEADNRQVAEKLGAFIGLVDSRQRLYTKGLGAMLPLLADIRATVRVSIGAESAELRQVASMIRTIRGEKLRNPRKKEDEESVSQSQRSYGSMVQLFDDLVSYLATLPGYVTTSPNIRVPALQQLVTQLRAANDQVTEAYVLLKTARDKRNDSYQLLRDRISRVKSSVKAQFGADSSLYWIIRSIRP